MSNFPAGVPTFRQLENLSGVVYDADDLKTIFAEDLNALGDNVSALADFLLNDLLTPSRVYVNGTNGRGSTNTLVVRYKTVVENVGSAITYASSSTLGDSFTINETGLYSIAARNVTAGINGINIVRNSTAFTTNAAQMLLAGIDYLSVANQSLAHVSGVFYLQAGDVVRTLINANPTDGTTFYFQIQKIYSYP